MAKRAYNERYGGKYKSYEELKKARNLEYLYYKYVKLYKAGEMKKSKYYSDRAEKAFGVNLEQKYHASLARREQDDVFMLGEKYKKIKYG
jgi:hypothetical protein